MAEFRLTPRAIQDLRDIWHHIADNEPAADKLISRIFDRLELACEHPDMDAARPELSATARILVEGRYVVIYEPTAYGVLAVAVVHGMRDPERWLS
ncbi:type II toxin-antitoxin system RelE/ParE family toxin [Mesorhizobium sp. M4B.F.Ca.ET.089.01.1.1]|uniref:type II toxin-antitoxin system RelE/ParE family toxin n=1 Tax=Mesorhizobium sp. M4B.F.Ca.ET.089.01.1.1 TaxID=2496662 RepID=UPI000FE318F9|nr:type II toxin-antitoxin system RelE/ParE family toxin [Mesorhizobium sp. M4B.F.Ca.ET.089.01.1.1]RWX61441.1 type II toxin-antitoxin system RelE/ParE family toxin [Mesorhizobium sp. M4B.F.Ca.ET.089.01.1.1]